ncbi:toprim domain-containing protein [Sedimentimonas flavescens]|uniref:DUF7146 domain-containing protein n=1 Tax=Sedimentimonas flavescens TaxID=2851012 RepID=UPI001C4A0E75|nr:toprim domain-containing protein [Sedimentimonas flavescens]MBW0159397.1 toprim domain-containing protein [Sedimentimonas flavescens]
MIETAERITRALNGSWYGRYGTAACPVCQSEGRKTQNALTLADGSNGRLLLNCKKTGCDFRDILAAARIFPGDPAQSDPALIAQREHHRKAEAEKRSRQAQEVWNEAHSIQGTLAETYLRGRGITAALSPTLRFHPSCWHGPSAQRHPALVARIADGDGFAVHRTYLCADGRQKAILEGGNKLMLGMARGGHVLLAEGAGPLVVAEGLETALSLASGLLRAPATIWGALSASGMSALHLPKVPGEMTVATDGDEAGRAAGHSLATRASAQGWTVSLLPAPEGRDWNDILNMKGAA